MGNKKTEGLFKGSIKNRIFMGFFVAVIPMVAIILMNYYPARDSTLGAASRLMSLSTLNTSQRLASHFESQHTVFSKWTKDDVFGMAIEFNALEELKTHFISFLKVHPEFNRLFLTDETGKILEWALGPNQNDIDTERLTTESFRIPRDMAGKKDLQVRLMGHDFKAGPGTARQESLTAVYTFRTRSSSGQPNGYVFAFLDWSRVQKIVDQMAGQMRENRFKSSQIALVDAGTETILSHSDRKFLNRRLPHNRALTQISAKAQEAVEIATERGREYAISTPIMIETVAGQAGGNKNQDAQLALAVFVTQKDILSQVRKITGFAVAVALGGGLLFFGICFLLARSITRPMTKLVNVLDAYEKGDMEIRADLASGDEIGFFAEKFNAMLEQIQGSARTLQKSESKYRTLFTQLQSAVNKKNYSFRFNPESKDDDLALSLNRMLSKLEKADISTGRQNWLKNGQTELNDAVRGERNLEALCRKAVTFVAGYAGARVATFYVKDRETDEFLLTANYAFRERKGFVNRFKPGEGLAGQAALEKQSILFADVPKDYMRIESSLGHTPPEQILVLPLVFEDEVKGVMELGSVKGFGDLEVEFVEQSGQTLAVTLNTTMFNDRLEGLLEQTREQSVVLEERQEELKAANEELEEQTQELKESEAKLQLQQEELQASNEEMEEKTEILEAQKEEIETKNVSLQIKQKEVENKAEQLELATRYKSEFLANMSHELRTPLNSLLILANMLAENEENNLTPDQVESAASIHRSGRNLLRLINDILDLSKIEAKKIELDISTISVQSIGDNCKTEFLHMAREKAIDLKIRISEDLPQTITTDELRLNQIVRNIVGNAVKFTEKGQVSLTIERPDRDVVPDHLAGDQAVAISVSDTGPGISEDQLSLIFEAFKQVDGSINRRHGGTGLGLSISRELTALLGGELSARSTPGKGTVFTLIMPGTYRFPDTSEKPVPETKVPPESRTDSQEEAAVQPEKKELKEKKRGLPTAKTMLIVEDDPTFAAILADFFQKNGYESIIASDGETGIKFVLEYQPTAIILDIGLPGVDGWAVLSELKNNPATRHIPVHIMSAFDNTRMGLEKGAVGYLTKPVDTRGLQTALSRIENVLVNDVKELLIIEDDRELRASMLKLMKTRDINCITAETGKKGLDLLRERVFDCMILDLGLPDISGFNLLDMIHADPDMKKIPVIIYTGRDLSEDEASKLEGYSSSIVLKNAASMARLLDETALFMHRVENDMPEEHKKMIRDLKDRESILPGKRVLLVDDDMRNAFALNKFLKSKGMEVSIANNGKKALEILENETRPDIVLMDVMMPVMDGYEAMKKIRGNRALKDIPILALTAKAMESDREECIRCGANDYLSKPVDTSKLLSMLRVWLYA